MPGSGRGAPHSQAAAAWLWFSWQQRAQEVGPARSADAGDASGAARTGWPICMAQRSAALRRTRTAACQTRAVRGAPGWAGQVMPVLLAMHSGRGALSAHGDALV